MAAIDSPEPQITGDLSGISVAQSKLVRLLWNVVGTLFLVLGLVGIPLPLLPTTPFLLIAAACYLRGSKRMYDWMMKNKYFGAYLRDYLEGNGLTIRTKVVALSMLWVVIALSVALVTESTILRVGLLAVASGVTIHILALKTRREI